MTANERLPYQIDPLSAHYDRVAFASGAEPLDRYSRCKPALTDAAAEQFYIRYRFLRLLGRHAANVLADHGDRRVFRLLMPARQGTRSKDVEYYRDAKDIEDAEKS